MGSEAYGRRLGSSFLVHEISERQLSKKWRCFLSTCCNRIAPLLNQRAQQIIEVANNFVEQTPDAAACELVSSSLSASGGIQSNRLVRGLSWTLSHAAGELRAIAGHHAFRAALDKSKTNWEQRSVTAMRSAMYGEAIFQSDLIRKIVGNPFK